jgi:predicted permease
MQRLRRALATLRARARFERDMRDELGEHLHRRAGDLERDGLSPAEAMRQARLEFGALEAYKEQCRDAGGLAPFRPFLGLGGDLALGARRLLATPLFLLFAVLSLALGVAVPTTVYSILYELMWKPVGVGKPADVALLTAGTTYGRENWRSAVSPPDFDDLQRRQRSFAEIAAFTTIAQAVATPTVTEVADIEAVSGAYFAAVGVGPMLGRVLQPSDDERAQPVALLSDHLWRLRFDADPTIVGRTLRIGSQPFEIVGVAPASFLGLTAGGPVRADLWIPLTTAPRIVDMGLASPSRDARHLSVVGRLAPGQTVDTARAELRTIGASLDTQHPITKQPAPDKPRIAVRRTWSSISVSDRRPLPGLRIDLLLLALTFLVLLVACTNLGNLLLSRGAERAHELAVRRALGGSRWRLVRELLAESGLIALAGAFATVPVTQVVMWLTTREVPTGHGVMFVEPSLSLPAMAVAAGALLASMLVFGLEPAIALTRDAASTPLASEAGAAPPRRGRRQRAFIRWQVAISVSFFLIAAVLARLLIAEARHDSGIALDRLALVSVHFKLQGWEEPRARRALDRVRELAGEYPMLDAIAVSSGLPFGSMTPITAITPPERPFVKGARAETAALLVASREIFATLGVPIVRGRAFDDRDDITAPRVGVISEYTALKMFGTRDAVGRQLTHKPWYGGYDAEQTFTVVGISRDTDVDQFMSRGDNLIYIPLAQMYLPNMMIVGRTNGDPADAARALQTIARRADGDLGTGTAGPAAWLTAGAWVAARAVGALATGLGLLTLLLAMVGLYGVLAQTVAHRTREVGVRLALGARTSQIARKIVREGFRPVLQGLLVGMIFGTLARAAVRAMFVAPIQVIDPIALVVVPMPLAIAAFLACYAPARRAARVDPNVALRHL